MKKNQSLKNYKITPREYDVIACVINGRSAKSIAKILKISPRTAETHLYNFMAKLDLSSRQSLLEFFDDSPDLDFLKQRFNTLIGYTSSQEKNDCPKHTPSQIFWKRKNWVIALLALSALLLAVSYHFWQSHLNKQPPLHFYSHPELTTWNLPHTLHDQIERKGLTKRIKSILHDKSNQSGLKILGLSGLAGVGKTTLAASILNNPEFEYTFKAWFPSESIDVLNESYIRLGERHQLFMNNIPDKVKIEIVRDWLQKKQDTLLVYDNAPDMHSLIHHLPKKGQAIITSRNHHITGAFKIGIMEHDEAMALFQKALGDLSDSYEHYKRIAETLGHLPLALSQAASYIKQNRITPENYLQLYQNARVDLLTENTLPASHFHKPVYKSLEIIFEKIQGNKLSNQAFDVLSMIALCHAERIPKKLLMVFLTGDISAKSEIILNRVITFLSHYSLLTIEKDHVSVHRIVHDWLRDKLLAHNKVPTLKKAMKAVIKLHPQYSFQSKEEMEWVRDMMPHMKTLLPMLRPHIPEINLAKFLSVIGNGYFTIGHYETALHLSEEVLAIYNRHKGQMTTEIADELSYYSQYYLIMGQYEKSKQYSRKALDVQEKNHGLENLKTLYTLGTLAEACVFSGEYEKAEQLMKKRFEITKRVFGEHHLSTIHTLNRVGFFNLYFGKYKKAEKLLQQGLNIFQNQHPSDHKDISTALLNLGWANLYLGNYSDSIKNSQQALEIQKRHYRNAHIATTFTTHSIGLAYLFLGNTKKAFSILEENLKMRQKTYGADHVRVAYVVNSMGVLQSMNGDSQSALASFKKAHDIVQKKFGDNHILTHRAALNLGIAEYFTGSLEHAKKRLQKSLQNLIKITGEDNINVGVAQANLGLVCVKNGDQEKGTSLLTQAKKTFNKHLSKNHYLNILIEAALNKASEDSFKKGFHIIF